MDISLYLFVKKVFPEYLLKVLNKFQLYSLLYQCLVYGLLTRRKSIFNDEEIFFNQVICHLGFTQNQVVCWASRIQTTPSPDITMTIKEPNQMSRDYKRLSPLCKRAYPQFLQEHKKQYRRTHKYKRQLHIDMGQGTAEIEVIFDHGVNQVMEVSSVQMVLLECFNTQISYDWETLRHKLKIYWSNVLTPHLQALLTHDVLICHNKNWEKDGRGLLQLSPTFTPVSGILIVVPSYHTPSKVNYYALESRIYCIMSCKFVKGCPESQLFEELVSSPEIHFSCSDFTDSVGRLVEQQYLRRQGDLLFCNS